MTEVTALSIQNVSKNFGGLVAVDQMTFDVMEHEVVGLIGPNGSGKTTMLNLISGFLKLSSGQVGVFGKSITGRSANRIARRGIARTFQLVRMLPSMTVRENVAAGGVFGYQRYWGVELDRRTNFVIEQVGLGGKDAMPVVALTYIDQKRVELARALISDPQLILLDEWLAGLNPKEMEIGIKLINELRFEGRTLIIVEHYMDAIRSLCDRCIVMNSGAKIAEGSPHEVLSDPEVVRAYLGDNDA
ncbi:MAG: ABC transporter ATP-binding protein [Rhodospirillaceae bacterium]|jgi:branched-chain amino acid transport system ATP-binding protein|nr:ABC transporter ATP-binding protein [Rhodospirillaceae bacterium]MBT7956739.1 ABC transporter ATP-binding protein [Rhodospirillaceae bacterium]